MTPEQIVDLDRIEKFLARGRRHASNFWNINDDGYCMASVLDAAPAMVAELRALRAESAQLARLRERLERLRPLEAAATPGPWHHGPSSQQVSVGPNQVACRGFHVRCDGSGTHAEDAALIAASRNAIAEMLRVVGS